MCLHHCNYLLYLLPENIYHQNILFIAYESISIPPIQDQKVNQEDQAFYNPTLSLKLSYSNTNIAHSVPFSKW